MNRINVPQLRFSGFEGEWEEKKLEEMAKFKAGYAFKSQQMLSIKSNYQLIKMSNVYQNELRLDRNPSYWKSIDSKQKEFLLKKGDTVLTLTGTVGKKDYGYSIKIEDDNKYLLNQRLVLLRELQNKSDSGFLSCLISNERFLFYFFAEAKGGTGNQTNVSTEDVKNIKLNFPSLPEQQKIASFLSAVDEKIQQLSRKKQLLEQYKKGVMQQLFSGKLRFKDENGKDYEDWEEKKLIDITAPIKRTTDRIIDNIMTISGANGFMDQKDRFSQVIAAGSLSKYTHLLRDEFAYNRGNSKSYKYGCIYKLNHKEALIPYVYHSFKLNSGVPEFMEQLFKAKYLDSQLRALISSSARMDGLLNIGAGSFFQVNVIFPSISEQQKIANFLSNIDIKIENSHQEINKMQNFKKGLLQQMFV